MNVIVIRTTKGGEVLRKLTPYPSNESAESNFHDEMRKAIADSNIVRAVAELMDDEGQVKKVDRWKEEVKNDTTPIEGVNA